MLEVGQWEDSAEMGLLDGSDVAQSAGLGVEWAG